MSHAGCIDGCRWNRAGRRRLKNRMPDALYLPWTDSNRLARIFPSSDVLLFPSRFDTFGRVVLEAMSCGLPVVAYDCKGPRDIIIDGECGFTVGSTKEMSDAAISILSDPELRERFQKKGMERAGQFKSDVIIRNLTVSLDITNEPAMMPAFAGF